MHPGIEVRLTHRGTPVFAGDSDFLHYWAKYAGTPFGEWMSVVAWDTCHGVIRLELRAAELGDWDEDLAELAGMEIAPDPARDPLDSGAELADVDQVAAAPVDQAVDVDQARARLDQAAAELAGVTKPGLNHEFIRATLADVGEVARQLRGARLGTIAGHLEQAAAIAWEVGSALKSAGL